MRLEELKPSSPHVMMMLTGYALIQSNATKYSWQ